MKKRNLLVGLFSMLGLVTMGNSMFAQQNLGSACGCPPVANRITAAITSTPGASWTTLPASAYGKELTSGNVTLTCDKIWTLDEKLYIGSGATLTIQPGTVIKGSVAPSVAAARALIIERGGKIMAPGTEDCPIVFTAAADNLDGTYSVNNKGMWGGILICGKASNNLTLAANGPFVPGQSGKMAVADGLGVLEGFASSYPQDQFGVAISSTQGYTALSGSQSYSSGSTYSWSPSAAPRNVSGTTTLVLSASANAALAALTGFSVTGTGIASGTTATISSGSANVTLSTASTANLSGTYTFSDGTTTLTATAASVINNIAGATSVSIGSTPLFSVQGLAISGTGIPANTIIGSVSGNTLNLVDANNASVALTASITSGNVTITGTYPTSSATSFQNVSGSTVQGPVVFANGSSGQLVNLLNPAPAGGQSFDDNDNSGVMTYVSIRHSGANLLVGSEINGLTLASVGRGTKIEHIEIVSCADDNIELFGGTVDLKYCTTLFGNDDMYDYDLGWSGRGQFLFGMKAQHATSGTIISPDNDNGFECDSDDNRSYNTPYSVPKFYNATVIGNAKSTTTTDNTGMAAIQAKDFTGGEFYNSIFSNFRQGVNFATTTANNGVAGTSRGTNLGGDAWHNYLPAAGPIGAGSGNGSERLKIKCNTFVGNSFGVTLGAGTATPSGSVILAAGNVGYDKFVGIDNNIIIASATGIPGFSSAFEINPTTNAIITKNDVTPNPALPLGSGCSQAPMDGFFEPANYRGAFSSVAGDNWLSDWSYSQVLGTTSGVAACPTDLNGDGITNTADFLIFAPAFGTSCN